MNLFTELFYDESPMSFNEWLNIEALNQVSAFEIVATIAAVVFTGLVVYHIVDTYIHNAQ